MQAKLEVVLSKAAQKLLSDNQVDILQELRRSGLDVVQGDVSQEAEPTEARSMDVSLLILAAGASFPLVCAGIARIIRALGGNPELVVDEERVPARTASGEIAYDKQGNVVYETRKTHRLLAPDASDNASTAEMSAELIGAKLTVKTSD